MNSARQQRRSVGSGDSPTRDALVEAARTCIREHGVAGSTSRLIAATADANLGAITYYFGSKDELVAEVLLGELSARLTPAVVTLEDPDTPATARLLDAMRDLVVEFESVGDEASVYLDALMLVATPGTHGERAGELLVGLQARLAEVISELRAAGVIASWVDAEAMASLLFATGNGIALQSRLNPGGPSVASQAGQLAGLLLAAASPVSAPSEEAVGG